MGELRRHVVLVAVAAVVLAACGGAAGPVATEPSPPPEATGPSGTLRLYTSVTQDTVDAVVAAYREANPGVTVDVLRAPTGELTARIAAEQREGGIQADVLWLTDPLTMFELGSQDLLRAWEPSGAGAVPPEFRTDRWWGTRLLNLVVVHGRDVDPAPQAWSDLPEVGAERPVAIPDPEFAGSAFGALAFFGLAEGFGFDFYRALEANGLVEVRSPGDVVTGVAEGQFAAGMTLDKVARDAIADGAPIELVAPEPGAIAIYSPIGVVEGSDPVEVAESFVEFTLTPTAQEAIAGTGWQPVRADVPWEHDVEQVVPDWDAAFGQREELVQRYRAVVGG